MVLHSYYLDEKNHKIYLEDVINDVAFYRVGTELVTSTVKFFSSKYRLCE